MCQRTHWYFWTTMTWACRKISGRAPRNSTPNVSCRMAASSSRNSSSPLELGAARAWATKWRSWSAFQSLPIYWDHIQSHLFPGNPIPFRWAHSQCRRSHMNFKLTFDIEIFDLLLFPRTPSHIRQGAYIFTHADWPHDWQNTRLSSIADS